MGEGGSNEGMLQVSPALVSTHEIVSDTDTMICLMSDSHCCALSSRLSGILNQH